MRNRTDAASADPPASLNVSASSASPVCLDLLIVLTLHGFVTISSAFHVSGISASCRSPQPPYYRRQGRMQQSRPDTIPQSSSKLYDCRLLLDLIALLAPNYPLYDTKSKELREAGATTSRLSEPCNAA